MPTIEFTREETDIVTYREDITEQQYANLVAGEVEDVQAFFDTLLEDNYDLDPCYECSCKISRQSSCSLSGAEETLDQGVWIQWRDVDPPYETYKIPPYEY